MSSIYHKTPLIRSTTLSNLTTKNIWLKMEALQPCGSFKARGISHACQHYKNQGAQLFISSSGGNAGLAVAYSGSQLGVPVKVVVPETTKQRAIDLIQGEGAEVIVHGEHWLEAHEYANSLVNHTSAYLHPFDDPLIWQGHASIIQEIVETGVQPDGIILSVGGGGLFCGVIEGLKKLGVEHIPVLAMETIGAESLHASYTKKQHIAIDGITSIASSLGATRIADKAFEYCQNHPVSSEVVSDKAAVNACTQFLDDHRLLVEPACGASLAAIYDDSKFLQDKQNIVVIVCGGVGMTLDDLLSFRKQFEV